MCFFRAAAPDRRVTGRAKRHVRRPSWIRTCRANVAARVPNLLGCPAQPLNLTDGQVAQLRDPADLDALRDDPLQCVAGPHLRRPHLANRVLAFAQGQDGFGRGGLDPFVAGGPVVVHGDPPLAGLGPCLLFQLRDPSHSQCPSVPAEH